MHRLLRPRMGASLVVERSRDRRRMAAGGGTAAVPFGKRRGPAEARQGGEIFMKVLVAGANGQLGRSLGGTVPTERTGRAACRGRVCQVWCREERTGASHTPPH